MRILPITHWSSVFKSAIVRPLCYLARDLLRGRILFFCSVAALFLGSCDDGFRLVEEQLAEEGATIHLKSFKRESLDLTGNKQWEVSAEEAFVYMEGTSQNRIVALNFKFQEFDEQNRIINKVQAQRGEINHEKKLVYLQGNVESKNQAGRQVNAQKMTYDMQERVLVSNQEVVIDQGATHLRCSRGATIYMDQNRQICKGPTVLKQNRPDQKNEPGLPTDFNLFE